jgi:hypothetical protein
MDNQILITILFSIITGLVSYIASSSYIDKQSKKLSKLINNDLQDTDKTKKQH